MPTSPASPPPWRWVPAGFAAGELRDAEAGLIAVGVAKRDGVLLAAAPELLAALRDMVSASLTVAPDVPNDVVEKAVTAIAKAEGREP